jgi:hypothetical protein
MTSFLKSGSIAGNLSQILRLSVLGGDAVAAMMLPTSAVTARS